VKIKNDQEGGTEKNEPVRGAKEQKDAPGKP